MQYSTTWGQGKLLNDVQRFYRSDVETDRTVLTSATIGGSAFTDAA